MKYCIYFTVVGSDDWLCTYDDCELLNENNMEERVAELLAMKLKEDGIKRKAEHVKLFKIANLPFAESNDIRKLNSLKIYKDRMK